MRIAVALATYNGGKYLELFLNSLSYQILPPDELIVSDDASTDNTLAVINAFAMSAPFPVTIFSNKKNVGYSQNFSNALSHCFADLVFCADQDDYWLPDKINFIKQKFVEHPNIVLTIHDIEFCNSHLTPIGQSKLERMNGVFDLNSEYVVGMATAIRGEFLKICMPIPNSLDTAYDNWLHSCSVAVEKKMIVPEILALHRRHASNATTNNILNVDYITNKSSYINIKFLMKRKQISTASIRLTLDWLILKRNALIDGNYIDELSFNRTIQKKNEIILSLEERRRILTLPVFSRTWFALKLYFRGGYSKFSGIKSVIRDILSR
ncbi:glycosyltransferase [Hydrogenophaga sp.]|uniref:glycosyltransferase n=1 Tax=Hydrogenophaga sp. TaxID=1904254 RepID=UPI0027360CFD|nr:glycosyltransferase [Hydrogenophaga sp.]MDP3884873.1 glycosyltransferase [Hydrogenophaga sp.]